MKKTFKIIISSIFILGILGYFLIFYSLPDSEKIIQYEPTSTVIDFSGFYWPKNIKVPLRKYVPLREISNHLRIAVIISEDDTFYRHSGINTEQMQLAFKQNFQQGRFVRGASTITMQLARNAFLTKEKSLIRKLREIILAKRIEKALSKSRILELYLNIIEWGPNIYGAEAASWYYFNKSASRLNIAEASLLAAIIINPKRFNPYIRFNSARKLQHRVLRLMRDAKIITPEEMDLIFSQQIVLRGI